MESSQSVPATGVWLPAGGRYLDDPATTHRAGVDVGHTLGGVVQNVHKLTVIYLKLMLCSPHSFVLCSGQDEGKLYLFFLQPPRHAPDYVEISLSPCEP